MLLVHYRLDATLQHQGRLPSACTTACGLLGPEAAVRSSVGDDGWHARPCAERRSSNGPDSRCRCRTCLSTGMPCIHTCTQACPASPDVRRLSPDSHSHVTQRLVIARFSCLDMMRQIAACQAVAVNHDARLCGKNPQMSGGSPDSDCPPPTAANLHRGEALGLGRSCYHDRPTEPPIGDSVSGTALRSSSTMVFMSPALAVAGCEMRRATCDCCSEPGDG